MITTLFALPLCIFFVIDWNSVRDFIAVADIGSFTAASKKLGISQPTLSRRLRALERALGVQLVVRSAGGLKLTQAGEELLERAQGMSTHATYIEDAILGQDASLEGIVRVSVTEVIGATWLAPLIIEFQRSYPRIRIELILDNTMVNLLSRDADIAMRLIRPTQGDLITRCVSSFRTGLYASRSYASRKTLPETMAQAMGHDAIGLVGSTPTAEWTRGIFGEKHVLLTNSLLAILEAVRSGLGIGPVLQHLGEEDPELIGCLPCAGVIKKDIWLTTSPALHRNARIRAVYDFLLARIDADRERLGSNLDAQ